MEAPGNECHGTGQQQLRQKAGQEIIAGIDAEVLAKDRLGMNRKEFFEGNENRHQQEEPHADPEDVHREDGETEAVKDSHADSETMVARAGQRLA